MRCSPTRWRKIVQLRTCVRNANGSTTGSVRTLTIL